MPKPLRANIDWAKVPLSCPGCSYQAPDQSAMVIHWYRTNVIGLYGKTPHSDKVLHTEPIAEPTTEPVEIEVVNSKTALAAKKLPIIHLPIIPISWQMILISVFTIWIIAPTVNHILIKLVDENPIAGVSLLAFTILCVFKDTRRKVYRVAYLLPIAILLSRWL